MSGRQAGVPIYRLAWRVYLHTLAYALLLEVVFLWVLALAGAGSGAVKAFLRPWWIWPSLTAALGLAGLLGTRVGLDERALTLRTFGLAWHGLLWRDVLHGRVLKVGSTVAVLFRGEEDRHRLWRLRGVTEPDLLARAIAAALGHRHAPGLTAPYRSRRGILWTVGADSIQESRGKGVRVYTPDTLRGIKFLFLKGEDLPLRLFLFPADGDRSVSIAGDVGFYTFLAADILRLARRCGIRIVCADLGGHKPRRLPRRHEEAEPEKPAVPRAWEEEGWR